MKRIIFLAMSMLLSACADDVPVVSKRGVSYAAPVAPSGMSYDQYKNYVDAKAARDGGEEQWQRSRESSEGNHALHKRFMAMDRNNNGSLSADEFKGD